LRAWALQRATAVYLAGFALFFALYFLTQPPADHAAWQAWVARPWVNLGLLLFVPALLMHAWVGMRDVLIDYVRPAGPRVLLLGLLAFGLVASGLWALQALILARMG
jgi:succinate dehydrogenase / fumarate reductase membrane anchor subunit